MADTDQLKITVVAFARVREVLGSGLLEIEVSAGGANARPAARDVWAQLAADHPELTGLLATTRFARKGALIGADDELHDGDELALLPPVGGG